jgi:anaerobic selenocysteine-containing dehydrogenase
VLSGLSFMVSVDPYLNETTRHAHVILPPPSPLTRSHYDVALSRLSVRNRARWSPALFAPNGPSEAEILARLELIALGRGAHADPRIVFEQIEQQMIGAAQRRMPALRDKSPEALSAMLEASDPIDRWIEIMVRTGAYGDELGATPDGLTFGRLRDSPHGIDLGPLEPALPDMLKTVSGRVELVPSAIRADFARLYATLEVTSTAHEFVLIGRRDLRSNNSWMHNLPMLIKGRPRCTLQMHPDDASRLTLSHGQSVRVRTHMGELLAAAELTDTIMPGVVSLPHGYGHDRPGTRQRVAAANAGVNFNLLTDAQSLDPLSGNAVLSGIPVTLSPA